jgi:aspartate 1-decarboxylase
MRTMLKSKIHRATVTGANIAYEGSITLDKTLMEAADILPYEMVHVLNVNNGQRFTTYAIEGEADSGTVCLNGAAARLVSKGDIVIILTYNSVTEEEAQSMAPSLVYVDSKNVIVHQKNGKKWLEEFAESFTEGVSVHSN